jgi:cysteinyl-tRNA synthetase
MLAKFAKIAGAFAIAVTLAHGLAFGAEAPLRLSQVKSWAFQLQNVDPLEIKQSPYDLVVIDYGFDKQNATAFPREIVDLMRQKPNGGRRLILAYFSIGEAENYRYYWADAWNRAKPDWLGPENPEWPGNYPVQYWRAEWQTILLGSPLAYLDRIIDAGFDGVYIDGADKYTNWATRRPSAANDMVDLIAKIAAYARARRNGFLIVPQNGDDLLDNMRYLRTIDGFGREELLYGERGGNNQRNSASSISFSVRRLQSTKRAGKTILVVEYPDRPELAPTILKEIRDLGFVGYIAGRELSTLTPPAVGCGKPDCSQ